MIVQELLNKALQLIKENSISGGRNHGRLHEELTCELVIDGLSCNSEMEGKVISRREN